MYKIYCKGIDDVRATYVKDNCDEAMEIYFEFRNAGFRVWVHDSNGNLIVGREG